MEDIKLSQLLQKLKSNATHDILENLIKTLWSGKVHDSIKDILIVSKEDIDSFSVICLSEKISDISLKTEIYSTSNTPSDTSELFDRIKNLEHQIAEIKMRTGARPNARNEHYF